MANRANYIRGHELEGVARGFKNGNMWSIMADCFDDHASDGIELAEPSAALCRFYPQFENMRRCGMPIPQEDALQFAEFNALYDLPEEVELSGGEGASGTYNMRVGPFYTGLRCNLGLASNWHWLDDEPVRHLELVNLAAVEDLGLILRNHRMEWISTIRLRFNRRVNPAHVADLVKQMTTTWLNCYELFIDGVEDRLKLIRTAFNMLRAQPRRGLLRGAKLYINGRPD